MDPAHPNELHTCCNCIWCGQCCADEVCDDFSPADDVRDITYYEEDLKMRHSEYLDEVLEYADDWTDPRRCGDG